MSDTLADFDREIIYDHYTRPRHHGAVGGGAILLQNPSCGDKLTMSVDFLRAEEGAAPNVDIEFDGKGCSISQASASMMAELLSGKSREEALQIAETVLSVFRGDTPPEALEPYGDVSALSGIASLPVRAKCAALAWQGAVRLLKKTSKSDDAVDSDSGA